MSADNFGAKTSENVSSEANNLSARILVVDDKAANIQIVGNMLYAMCDRGPVE